MIRANMLSGVLQRLLGGDVPPNKVQDIKSDALGMCQVILRDEAMVLYAPPHNQTEKKLPYEIILQRPINESSTNSFSLFRAATQAEAEERFNAFAHRLPTFVSVVKEFYNINGLQKVCDALAENPSWSLAHLVAFFNLTEYISHAKIVELLDYPDHANNMTPLQLAIKSNNIEMVKALMPYCKMEHLDNNSNSVYHYAGTTCKEMINLLASRNTANLNHLNTDGFTPLHLACLSDKPDCVKGLLVAGADVNMSANNMSSINRTGASMGTVAEFIKQNPNKLATQDMKYGGTPLHWCSSRETVQALIERGCNIDALNFDGRTALHIMVARNRLECLVTLLAHDAEVDIPDKNGNTALHIAIEMKHVPIVQCLVVFGCDINKKNKEGKSPRHMVGKEASGSKEDEILYILHSVGAKRCPESETKCPPGCNAKGTYDGIPPVTPEAVEQREHIEEMLASTSRAFLKPNLLNQIKNGNFPANEFSSVAHVVDTTSEQKGQSVMDALLGMFSTKAVKAAAPPKKLSTTNNGEGTSQDLIEITESNSSNSSSTVSTPVAAKKGGRLLCLDGGGIRGLVLVQLLLEVEKLANTPIVHMFDWIAGTSTGGILALGLGSGKTIRQCMGLYLRMKQHCFTGSRPYSSELLESILKENLGEFSVMTDIKHPKIMVTAVMADRKPVDLHLFRNYKSTSDILGIVTPTTNRRIPPPPPEEQLIWRAARATGAAPSYFRAFGRFLDGGLYANNPTLDAMTEIHEYNRALQSVGRESETTPLSIVVSLGTGMIPVTELKEIDVFRPENPWDTARLAYGLSTIGTLLVDQATVSDGRVVDRARAWCSTINVPYFRFNPPLPEDIAMDEKNDQKLINMMWQAKAYMHSNRKKIIDMINLLK